jgi:lysophospholipase L1-like esterase
MTRAALWIIAVLLAAEGAVRGAAIVLRRDAPARPGASAIYCVGDSFTYGQGVRTSEAWPQVLAGLLPERDAPVVRVMAQPGNSSSVVLADVASALAAGDARMILVLAGWNANDGDFAAWRAGEGRPVPWSARLDLLLAHSRLYRVAKHALTVRGRTQHLDDVEVIPQTTEMQLYDFRAYQEIARANLTSIVERCRAAGVPCALLTYPHVAELPANPYSRTELYHVIFGRTALRDEDYLIGDRRPDEIAIDAVIRDVSEREDAPLIDLQPAFTAAGRADLFQADLHHPTAAGHALMARTVFEALRR